MKILILTIGTRGDVQPYVALGAGLARAGHEVVLCANSAFESFVTERGLRYAPMTNGLVDLLESHEVRALLERTTNLFNAIRTGRRLAGRINPIWQQMVADCWSAVQQTEPDVLLFHAKLTPCVHFAEKLGIPAIMAPLVPLFVPTAQAPAMGFPSLGWGRYNRFTYRVVALLTNVFGNKMINAWRAANGMSPVGYGFETLQSQGCMIPVVHALSPAVATIPQDWPSQVIASGYWFLDADAGWEPPSALVDFLEAGEPPVYCGFGSMVGLAPERLTQTIIEAFQRTGVRGILATGWGGLQPHDLPEQLFVIDKSPHDWLFPRVAAVIHHGGAGTTAAGLRFGRPTLICPLMVDQPYWGARVHQLGAGVAPIRQRHLTAENLSRALHQLTQDPSLRARASAIQAQLATEDGIATAVRFIEQQVPRR
ncbi:MAG: glycosyltransferase [Planctomycetota bacterium]